MARGLVRMERESGFCIWEQRGGKKKKNNTQRYQTARASAASEPPALNLNQPQHRAVPRALQPGPTCESGFSFESLDRRAHLHRDAGRVQIKFPKEAR